INFDLNIGHAANAGPRVQSLPVFLCPSDNGPPSFTPARAKASLAFANYVGSYGSGQITEDHGDGGGIFYRNSKTRIGDIRDGTSNTFLVGERSSRIAYSSWTGSLTGCEVMPNAPTDWGPGSAAVLCLGHTGYAEDKHTPNNPYNYVEDFSSNHAGGGNFVFADGSGRVISDGIDPGIWSALGTRAGGEPVPSDGF